MNIAKIIVLLFGFIIAWSSAIYGIAFAMSNNPFLIKLIMLPMISALTMVGAILFYKTVRLP